MDREIILLFGGVAVLLMASTVVGWIFSRTLRSESGQVTAKNINQRIRAWWMMAVLFFVSIWSGHVGTNILFGLISFMALREFVTLTPTRLADHRALFLAFFIVTPLHYYVLSVDWYGFFVVFIPVYVFLILPTRIAVAGDCEKFLERTAKIQWGVMICVYCVSHAPALLNLKIPGYEGQNAKLLFWFILVVELNDVFQYVWGKSLGRHKIAPTVSPNKTWEGFVGGTITAVALGASLAFVTPFSPAQAAGMALAITLMGFAGGLTMSAIKRDQRVKDFGASLAGHGGVLDRIDSLCFAAPIFFHLTRWYFGEG